MEVAAWKQMRKEKELNIDEQRRRLGVPPAWARRGKLPRRPLHHCLSESGYGLGGILDSTTSGQKDAIGPWVFETYFKPLTDVSL